MRNWLFTTEEKKFAFYKGIRIHADPDVHDQAERLFLTHVPRGSTVLDIGAGAGAFTQRLIDLGYKATPVDVDGSRWALEGVEYIEHDIQEGLAGKLEGGFDSVCCLEVIEHVENPWALFRDFYAMVRPGGRVVMSTPNITSFLSRLKFLRNGQFVSFGEYNLEYGHITPVTDFMLDVMARRTGFKVLEICPGGYLPLLDLSNFGFKTFMANFLRPMAYLMARGRKTGYNIFLVLERPADE